MSQFSITKVRTSTLQTSHELLTALQRTQREMATLQKQLSTGTMLNTPSDAPARTNLVLSLEASVEARNHHEGNLQHALGSLNNADQALGDTTDILIEAKSIASSQIGIGSNAQTRANQAIVIDAQIRALTDIANRQYQGISLFGGNAGTPRGEPVFVPFMGGIRYLGSQVNLTTDAGTQRPLGINTNGDDAFNSLSNRVQSKVDLNVLASSHTRIADVTGAQGVPIRLGVIQVTVNSTVVNVDLSTAETLGDVIVRIQDAIDSVDHAAGSIQIVDRAYELTAAAGQSIAIDDVGAIQIAADLGIRVSVAGGLVAGSDLDPHLTAQTSISDLGLAVDFANGLKITQGPSTKVLDFSAATRIEDLMNIVDQADLGIRLEINNSRSSLNLISEVSAVELAIGEVGGGTTAQDLGLRTFGPQTLLSDFRLGLGVESLDGEDDFAVELHDGRSFSVDIDDLATVGQVIDAMTASATAAGLSVGTPGTAGTDVNIGLALDSNGLQFEDGTSGANDFQVVQLNTSMSATHLGIYTGVGGDDVIVGEDRAKVRAESIFTHMIDLRNALENDDSFGITLAGDAIDNDIENLTRIRADVGSRAQLVERQQERTGQLITAERTLLSEIRDVDFTEAVTRFLQMQQQLNAALRVGSTMFQNSILEFLR